MISVFTRFRNILDFTVNTMLRRKGKNLLLVTLFTLVVAVFASILLFTQALRREAALILEDTPDIIVQRMVAGRHDLVAHEYAAKIAALPGVRSVKPRLWGYYFDPSTNATYSVMVPLNDAIAERKARIGIGVGRSRKLFPGTALALRRYDGKELVLQIESLLPEESELVSADLVAVSERDFRTLFSFPAGFATDLAVSVANPSELRTVARKIAETLPDTRSVTRNDIRTTYESLFDWRSGVMALIFSSVLLSFVIYAWDRASGLSAEERRETGILKSIGWETSDILLMKFSEGLIVSLVSFLGGCILGWLHIYFFSASLFGVFLKGWSTLHPHFRLMPVFDLYQLAVLFMLTVPPYVAAILIPSWRVAGMDPDAVMREH